MTENKCVKLRGFFFFCVKLDLSQTTALKNLEGHT